MDSLTQRRIKKMLHLCALIVNFSVFFVVFFKGGKDSQGIYHIIIHYTCAHYITVLDILTVYTDR